MIELMRQLILAMTALLSLLQAEEPKLGGAIPVKETKIISDIKTIQDNYFSSNGYYKQIPTYTDGIYEAESYKYRTPQNEYGYQTILRKTENGFVWERAVGFGTETISRTYDWIKVKELYNPTATTTPL